MSRRDPGRERVWLTKAERGRPSGFAAHAIRRLAAGERLFGDRWSDLGPGRLLDELAEEAADIGSWGVLALQALESEALPGSERARLTGLLLEAIAAGAVAHRAIQTARAEHLEMVK